MKNVSKYSIMKKIIIRSLLVVFGLCLSMILFIRDYIPRGSVVFEAKSELGQQLFQYAAAYSLAKGLNSSVFMVVSNKNNTKNPGNVKDFINEFDLTQLNKVNVNIFNKLYFKLLFNQKPNKLSKNLRKLFGVEVVNSKNYFSLLPSNKSNIYVISDDFDSKIFFEQYSNEIIKQFSFKEEYQFDSAIINKITESNAVCFYIDNDEILFSKRHDTFKYQQKATELAKKLIKNPNFYYFTNSEYIFSKELKERGVNAEYIKTENSLETLFLLSKCTNIIVNKNELSWWGGYLNVNKSIVIAPYKWKNEKFYNKISDLELKYQKRSAHIKASPKEWILLSTEDKDFSEIIHEHIKDPKLKAELLSGYSPREFSIYSGDRAQIELCAKGDFKPNLCYSNSKFTNKRPTVVTSYHQIKSKFKHNNYVEWAKNFLSIPFDLVIFTDEKNIDWIRELRGDLPLVVINRSVDEFYHYQFLDQYKKIAEMDNEFNSVTGVKTHSAELYILWNEKVKLVNEVINMNPYNSDFFIWCDFGIFRDKYYIKNNFLSNRLINQNKMTFVMNIEFSEEFIDKAYVYDNVTGAQGGLQIGDKNSWKAYDYLYNLTRDELLEKNNIFGKEQSIINSMIIRYPDLFDLIYQDPRDLKNRWWYGLEYYGE